MPIIAAFDSRESAIPIEIFATVFDVAGAISRKSYLPA